MTMNACSATLYTEQTFTVKREGNAMKKRYHVKSKKRFSVFVFLVVFMLTAATGAVAGSESTAAMSDPVYAEIQIESGDTLWDLANKYGPENVDTREIIHTICRINEISPDEIQPGQTILIPVS